MKRIRPIDISCDQCTLARSSVSDGKHDAIAHLWKVLKGYFHRVNDSFQTEWHILNLLSSQHRSKLNFQLLWLCLLIFRINLLIFHISLFIFGLSLLIFCFHLLLNYVDLGLIFWVQIHFLLFVWFIKSEKLYQIIILSLIFLISYTGQHFIKFDYSVII